VFPAWAESVVYQYGADSAHVLKRLSYRPKPAGRAVQLWLMKLFPMSIFMLPSFIAGFDLGIASIYAIGNGCALFFSRARYAA